MQRVFTSSNPKQPYIITEFDGFLTPAQCNALIELARPRLTESKIYEASSDTLDRTVRDSMQCWIYDSENHPVVREVTRKIEQIVQIPSDRHEALQVVRYQTGGFYRAHYDACDDTPEKCKRMNEHFRSQRYITFLVYLNDTFEGGETKFPKIEYSTRPKRGSAVMFFNTDQVGTVLPESLHGGEPLRSGEKWICNKWIHYPFIQENFKSLQGSEMRRQKIVLVMGIGLLLFGIWRLFANSQRVQKFRG